MTELHMSRTTTEYSVYQQTFGIEEETYFEQTHAGIRGARVVPASALHPALDHYQARDASGTSPLLYEELHEITYRRFNSAGDKTYVDCLSPERATAECSTVREAIVRSRGVEQFAAGFARSLLELDPEIEEIIQSRRVGYLGGDMVGTQDNIHVPLSPYMDPADQERSISALLTAQAITRPYLVGAGDYKNGQFYFAQKLARLGHYWGREMEVQPVQTRGTSRFEIRENDINICDAAALRRLGGSAIAAIVAQTSLYQTFEDDIVRILHNRHDLDWPDLFNMPVLNPDGTFAVGKNSHIMRASDFQLRLVDAFVSQKMRREAGEQPADLLAIAENIHDHSILMRSVLHGSEQTAALAPESDWAAKHACGLDPTDIDYDTIRTRRTADGIVTEKCGLGFELRDHGVFNGGISQAEVDQAYYVPPAHTRAALRGKLIKDYWAVDTDWHYVQLLQAQPDGSEKLVTLELDDPLQTELTAEQQAVLEKARRR